MKYLTFILLAFALSASAQQKIDTPMFKIEMSKPSEGEFIMDMVNHHCSINIMLNDNESVYINYKNGKPICDTPYSFIKSHHAIILFKRGKKIGAYAYFKPKFHLTNLKIQ